MIGRYLYLDDEIRARQVAILNSANLRRWLWQREKPSLPDLRNEDDLQRYRKVQYQRHVARGVLRLLRRRRKERT